MSRHDGPQDVMTEGGNTPPHRRRTPQWSPSAPPKLVAEANTREFSSGKHGGHSGRDLVDGRVSCGANTVALAARAVAYIACPRGGNVCRIVHVKGSLNRVLAIHWSPLERQCKDRPVTAQRVLHWSLLEGQCTDGFDRWGGTLHWFLLEGQCKGSGGATARRRDGAGA